jgi:hypothetical protein
MRHTCEGDGGWILRVETLGIPTNDVEVYVGIDPSDSGYHVTTMTIEPAALNHGCGRVVVNVPEYPCVNGETDGWGILIPSSPRDLCWRTVDPSSVLTECPVEPEELTDCP